MPGIGMFASRKAKNPDAVVDQESSNDKDTAVNHDLDSATEQTTNDDVETDWMGHDNCLPFHDGDDAQGSVDFSNMDFGGINDDYAFDSESFLNDAVEDQPKSTGTASTNADAITETNSDVSGRESPDSESHTNGPSNTAGIGGGLKLFASKRPNGSSATSPSPPRPPPTAAMLVEPSQRKMRPTPFATTTQQPKESLPIVPATETATAKIRSPANENVSKIVEPQKKTRFSSPIVHQRPSDDSKSKNADHSLPQMRGVLGPNDMTRIIPIPNTANVIASSNNTPIGIPHIEQTSVSKTIRQVSPITTPAAATQVAIKDTTLGGNQRSASAGPKTPKHTIAKRFSPQSILKTPVASTNRSVAVFSQTQNSRNIGTNASVFSLVTPEQGRMKMNRSNAMNQFGGEVSPPPQPLTNTPAKITSVVAAHTPQRSNANKSDQGSKEGAAALSNTAMEEEKEDSSYAEQFATAFESLFASFQSDLRESKDMDQYVKKQMLNLNVSFARVHSENLHTCSELMNAISDFESQNRRADTLIDLHEKSLSDMKERFGALEESTKADMLALEDSNIGDAEAIILQLEEEIAQVMVSSPQREDAYDEPTINDTERLSPQTVTAMVICPVADTVRNADNGLGEVHESPSGHEASKPADCGEPNPVIDSTEMDIEATNEKVACEPVPMDVDVQEVEDQSTSNFVDDAVAKESALPAKNPPDVASIVLAPDAKQLVIPMPTEPVKENAPPQICMQEYEVDSPRANKTEANKLSAEEEPAIVRPVVGGAVPIESTGSPNTASPGAKPSDISGAPSQDATEKLALGDEGICGLNNASGKLDVSNQPEESGPIVARQNTMNVLVEGNIARNLDAAIDQEEKGNASETENTDTTASTSTD